MQTFVIATCGTWPTLYPSDETFRLALERCGSRAIVKPWQAADFWDAADKADAVVVRATWDYPLHVEAFDAWLSRAETSDARVFNAPALMRWNSNKRYVFDLARAGVRMPRTALVEGAADLDGAFAEVDGAVAIIKPCHGASGRGVEKVTRAQAEIYLARNGGEGRSFLLQEMLPEIADGELSFVFIGGVFTHVVRKTPAPGEFRVNSAYGPASNALADVDAALVARAAGIVDRLPSKPIYARIDCVERAGQLICLEAEVIEPSLFMHLYPPAAERLATAVLDAAAA